MIQTYELSKILYDNDPMNTSCTVNKGMEDEYDSEARHIVYLLNKGVPFTTALHDVFSFFFWSGCLVGAKEVATIEAQYYELLSKLKI
jgi:hypothetical protein